MVDVAKKTKSVNASGMKVVPKDLIGRAEPIILKGLVSSWPLVDASMASDERAVEYLKSSTMVGQQLCVRPSPLPMDGCFTMSN